MRIISTYVRNTKKKWDLLKAGSYDTIDRIQLLSNLLIHELLLWTHWNNTKESYQTNLTKWSSLNPSYLAEEEWDLVKMTIIQTQ